MKLLVGLAAHQSSIFLSVHLEGLSGIDDQTGRLAALICNLNSQIKASPAPNLHHLSSE